MDLDFPKMLYEYNHTRPNVPPRFKLGASFEKSFNQVCMVATSGTEIIGIDDEICLLRLVKYHNETKSDPDRCFAKPIFPR